jgi:addiction module HigA family antidote
MAAASRSKSGSDDEAGRLTPGAHLRAEIERLGLDQLAVSKATGVSRQSVNNIVNGRQGISRAMAGKLGRLTGRSSDYWLSAFFASEGEALPREPYVGGVLVNHQIIRAVTEGVIGIEPFDAATVRVAAIDLTLDKALTLMPGAMMAARSKERVELPIDYLGRIGIAALLASEGILASHALQLEPGFKGEVDVRLFNAGREAVRLRAAQPLISLELFHLNATPDFQSTT